MNGLPDIKVDDLTFRSGDLDFYNEGGIEYLMEQLKPYNLNYEIEKTVQKEFVSEQFFGIKLIFKTEEDSAHYQIVLSSQVISN